MDRSCTKVSNPCNILASCPKFRTLQPYGRPVPMLRSNPSTLEPTVVINGRLRLLIFPLERCRYSIASRLIRVTLSGLRLPAIYYILTSLLQLHVPETSIARGISASRRLDVLGADRSVGASESRPPTAGRPSAGEQLLVSPRLHTSWKSWTW